MVFFVYFLSSTGSQRLGGLPMFHTKRFFKGVAEFHHVRTVSGAVLRRVCPVLQHLLRKCRKREAGELGDW